MAICCGNIHTANKFGEKFIFLILQKVVLIVTTVLSNFEAL